MHVPRIPAEADGIARAELQVVDGIVVEDAEKLAAEARHPHFVDDALALEDGIGNRAFDEGVEIAEGFGAPFGKAEGR